MTDAASTSGLQHAIGALLPALEAFTRFEGPDRAVPRSYWADLLDERLPSMGAGPEEVLRVLSEVVIPRGLRVGHPGFSGWVTTAPTTIAAAADLAQTVASPQRWWVQAGNHLDDMAVRWMIELLGFPESFVGQFTSGGSTANLIGLGAARQHAGERVGIDIARDGVAALPRPRVYASVQVHHVVGRALGVLGTGRESLRSIPLGDDGRIDVAALRAALQADLAAGDTPMAIVGNAGDVNTGLVDPLGDLADIAHEHDVWFHVDGAYGGFGILDDRVRARYGDPASYDSFAVDPHKWLAAPVGTGMVICRDGDLLGRSFTIETGGYDREREAKDLEGSDPESPWESTGLGTPDWGVDFSTPARGIAVWAILKEIGSEGIRDRVVRHNDCARLVARRAAESDELELVIGPELSIACFRYRPPATEGVELDDFNERILAELRRRGESLPSGTWLDGRFAIRPCFINPRTGLDEASKLVDDVLEIGRTLGSSETGP
ncbi:MAG TPA: aminotransferase class V-fold PLP-dependent enzyme [Acidimicrobiia bacterium]|nr:aminotransferase class V-fold PLP-dependent enzyme [Acidimicrobiia bacterium]